MTIENPNKTSVSELVEALTPTFKEAYFNGQIDGIDAAMEALKLIKVHVVKLRGEANEK